jgi:hypothetical protein
LKIQDKTISNNLKNSNNDDGDKEYYFDCTIMEKLKEVNLKATNELKPDGNLDLMDFISKSDFSTVGGKNN